MPSNDASLLPPCSLIAAVMNRTENYSPIRDRVRGFIQAMIEGELDETLMRARYGQAVERNQGLANLTMPMRQLLCIER